jgi:uncharacterized protein
MSDWTAKLEQSHAYKRWAPPNRRWDVAQQEKHLLFLHYAVDYDAIRALVPPMLEVEQFDNSAWVGLMALRLAKLHGRRLPIPKWWHQFPEVDLVTYVSYQGRRGVYFLSIESGRRIVSTAIRWYTALPYLYSDLTMAGHPGPIRVTSQRDSQGGPAAKLDLTYKATKTPVTIVDGSPLGFMLAQFSSFAIDLWGRVIELDEIHSLWEPVEVELEVTTNTLGQALGIDLPLQPTLAHAAASQRVLTWGPVVVRPGRPGLAPLSPPRPPPLAAPTSPTTAASSGSGPAVAPGPAPDPAPPAAHPGP